MDEPALEVTAAALSRNFALWQDRALREPVVITHHGRARSVLIGIDDYRRRLSGIGVPLTAQLLDETDQAMLCLRRVESEWVVAAINAAGAALARTTRERAVGQELRRLFRELGASDHIRRLDSVARHGEASEWRASGGDPERILAVRAISLGTELGVLISDVTAQVNGQSRLEAQPGMLRQFLDRLLGASALAYATLDGDGRFLFVSEGFARLAGWERDAFLDGMHLSDVLRRDDAARVDELLLRATAQIASVSFARGSRDDAQATQGAQVNGRIVALPGSGGRHPGYVVFLTAGAGVG